MMIDSHIGNRYFVCPGFICAVNIPLSSQFFTRDPARHRSSLYLWQSFNLSQKVGGCIHERNTTIGLYRSSQDQHLVNIITKWAAAHKLDLPVNYQRACDEDNRYCKLTDHEVSP